MGFAFRLMVLVIGFNIALGMTAYMFGGSSMFISHLDQNAGVTQTATLNDQMNLPSGVAIQDQSLWYRLIDIINLGFFQKILGFLNSTIFSITTILFNLSLIPSAFIIWFNSLLTIIFVLGMFELFTGRDLFQR